MRSTEPIVLVISTALTAVLWAWMWLFIISKIGYRGLSRKLWLVGTSTPNIPRCHDCAAFTSVAHPPGTEKAEESDTRNTIGVRTFEKAPNELITTYS